MHVGTIGWRLAVVAAYFARPWSCAMALDLQVRPADDPYRSVDPHGFGVMGAFGAALLLAPPVLWLLLQRRPPQAGRVGGGVRRRWARGVTVAVVGTPMVMQMSYRGLPLAWGWPILASAALWLGLVVAIAFARGGDRPSLHGAFDRHPVASWSILLAIGLMKVGSVLYAAVS